MSDKVIKYVEIFALVAIIGIVISAVAESVLPKKPIETKQSVQMSSQIPASQSADKSTGTSQADKEGVSTTSGGYYYNSLNEREREFYTKIYEAIVNRGGTVLEEPNDDVIMKIFQCVLNDHPEIFYCDAYLIEKSILDTATAQVKFKPQYNMSESEQKKYQDQINQYAVNCINSIPIGADEYTKVKHVYDYIITHTEYDINSENNQNICSVCVGGRSVCAGYAKTTQYILSQLGIECTLVLGGAPDEHAWNLVRLDGEYYYMDTTWGDAEYIRSGEENAGERLSVGNVNYEYFLIRTDEITKTHTIKSEVPMPYCVATRNNFYMREGLYVTMYSEAVMKAIFEQAKADGQGYVTFKCADNAVFNEAKEKLIGNGEIFNYATLKGQVSYDFNEQLRVFIFLIE